MEVCQLYLLMVQHWIETPDKASRTGSMHDWNGQNLAWKQQMWGTKEIGESLLYTLRPRSAYIILSFFCLNDLKSRRSSDGQDWWSGWPLLAGVRSTIRYAMKDSIILVAGYTHHDVYLITLWKISCGLDGHGLALIKTVRGFNCFSPWYSEIWIASDGMIPVIMHSNEGYT